MTMIDSSPRFLNLPPRFCDPPAARYAILPVPYEGTVSYKGGTAEGPAAIIDASRQVECFDEELRREFIAPGIATYPAVEPAKTPQATLKRVLAAATALVRKNKFLLTLGGEHSITSDRKSTRLNSSHRL